MSILTLLWLLVLAIVSLRFGRDRLAMASAALALLIFLAVGDGWVAPLLRPAAAERLSNPVWKGKNLILVLGGGVTPWGKGAGYSTSALAVPRVAETARLYFLCKKAGYQCKVLTTGGDPLGLGIPEAEVMGRELAELGVASGDLLLEKKSRNTFQNAEFCKPIVEEEKAELLILVSSGVHLRRAQLYFSHFGMAPQLAPADMVTMKKVAWPTGFNFMLFDQAMHEVLGELQYSMYQFLGWNKR